MSTVTPDKDVGADEHPKEYDKVSNVRRSSRKSKFCNPALAHCIVVVPEYPGGCYVNSKGFLDPKHPRNRDVSEYDNSSGCEVNSCDESLKSDSENDTEYTVGNADGTVGGESEKYSDYSDSSEEFDSEDDMILSESDGCLEEEICKNNILSQSILEDPNKNDNYNSNTEEVYTESEDDFEDDIEDD